MRNDRVTNLTRAFPLAAASRLSPSMSRAFPRLHSLRLRRVKERLTPHATGSGGRKSEVRGRGSEVRSRRTEVRRRRVKPLNVEN